MSEYDRIKGECLEKRELWKDPDFPAKESSMFYHQEPPFAFTWKRPREIFANPTFIDDVCDTFDVVPGIMGDKWLASGLGVLYMCKALFFRVVPADQCMVSSYAGIFRFRLWWCGQWMEVLVDDRLPTVNGKLAFLQPSSSTQLWPALLEKAFAKLHGSYEALKYSCLLDVLADLTGSITEPLPDSDIPDSSALVNILKTASIVTATHVENGESFSGLEPEMSYRIYNVEKVKTAGGVVSLVQLRGALAPGEEKVQHLIHQDEWINIPLYERERLCSIGNGFWMLYADFQKHFHCLVAVHLDFEISWAVPSLSEKRQWHKRIYQGAWRRGVTAGGCKNNIDFFHINPQLQLVLNEPDTVVISVTQHSVVEPKVIGFSIYKVSKPLTESAQPAFFKKRKGCINSQYTNNRQVSFRCQLDAGSYLLMPTTFEPRVEANFTLRVMSYKTLKMQVLDCPPQMLRTAVVKPPPSLNEDSFMIYESMFLQLADEYKMVDAFGLQDLLEACLPNDYIRSCASLDTCRQIVLSMDKRGAGRISLSDFKDLMFSLRWWQSIFLSHGREKIGILIAERLRDALREVGFVVPEGTMALLLLRYMRKDGMLRFGDFVSVVLHLHRAFNVFYTLCHNDTPTTGSLQLTLTNWLQAFMS